MKKKSDSGCDDEEVDEIDEPWMQNFVSPYIVYQFKKTQFFSTTKAFDLFEELICKLDEEKVPFEISSTTLKLKFPLTISSSSSQKSKETSNPSAASHSEEDSEKTNTFDITCHIEVMEVTKDAKYCIDFSYRDEKKRDVPYERVRKHYKAFKEKISQYNDTTFHE